MPSSTACSGVHLGPPSCRLPKGPALPGTDKPLATLSSGLLSIARASRSGRHPGGLYVIAARLSPGAARTRRRAYATCASAVTGVRDPRACARPSGSSSIWRRDARDRLQPSLSARTQRGQAAPHPSLARTALRAPTAQAAIRLLEATALGGKDIEGVLSGREPAVDTQMLHRARRGKAERLRHSLACHEFGIYESAPARGRRAHTSSRSGEHRMARTNATAGKVRR